MARVRGSRTSYDFNSMKPKQRIDFFFNNRMPEWFLDPLKSAMKAKKFMVVGLLIMIGIDMLSGYFKGKESGKQTFVDFLEEYFDYFKTHGKTLKKNPQYQKNVLKHEMNSKRNLPLSKIVYGIFRCGLAHNFMVYQGGSFGRNKRHYIHFYKHKGYHIDIDRLYKDFLKAYQTFEQDVRDKSDIRDKFLERFKVLWKR